MYEQHFGLNRRPFRSSATGTDVFVGPHSIATINGLKKAFVANDAITTVTGPVGSGKTTLVGRALDSIGENRKTVHVARMRLDSDDVLELLLDELGVAEKPKGTIQRFACFRRQLAELEKINTRVVVVLEDGARLGIDTLAEIEALTSADAGESDGACVVIMGDADLESLLQDTQLMRVQQRVRQRFAISPMPAAELRGYLRHCFRLAGGDFERVFETDAARLLHHLSGGIPRVTNNLVESAMAAASGQKLTTVATALLKNVAETKYGLDTQGFEPEPQSATQEPATAEAELQTEPAPEPVAEAAPQPEPVAEAAPQPEPVAEEQVPELIQDTLPDLEVLTPGLLDKIAEKDTYTVPELPIIKMPEPQLNIESDAQTDPAPLELTLENSPEPAPASVDSASSAVPAWERDPTMAELKPDLAALEQAMSFVKGDEPAAQTATPEASTGADDDELELIPEITLDHAIQQRIENNLIDEPGEVSPPDKKGSEPFSAPEPEKRQQANADKKGSEPFSAPEPEKREQADTEIQKIAAGLAKAKSLEDVDDKMAETLFGNEINLVAAEMFAKPPVDGVEQEETETDEAKESESGPGETAKNDATNTAVTNQQNSDVPDVEVTLEAPKTLDGGGMDLSASQRLKTVRALNADLHPSIREPEPAIEDQPEPASISEPESIEDQINTSMTQTLKALNVAPPVINEEDEEEEAKSGFFSRFKRS